MSSSAFYSFLDELEKIAVSVKDLYQGVSRAGNIKIGPSPIAARGGGGVTVPAEKVVRGLAERKVAPARRVVSGLETARSYLPTALTGAAKKRGYDVDQAMRQARRLPKDMEDYIVRSSGLMGMMDGGPGKGFGRIAVDPKALDTVMPAMAGTRRAMSSADSDALSAVVGSHELAERAVKKRHMAPVYSHLSPEVLLKEHNLLSRLTGKGSDHARATMRGLRRTTGEADHMRHLLMEAFGPRAGQFMAEGEKVPAAMRRALRRRLQEDPSLLSRALKSAKRERGVMGQARHRLGQLAGQARAGSAAFEQAAGKSPQQLARDAVGGKAESARKALSDRLAALRGGG